MCNQEAGDDAREIWEVCPLQKSVLKLKKRKCKILDSMPLSTEVDWFISYLGNKRQCCNVNGNISEIKDIKCGMPQGSCLGPIPFLSMSMTCHLPYKEPRSQCMQMTRAFPIPIPIPIPIPKRLKMEYSRTFRYSKLKSLCWLNYCAIILTAVSTHRNSPKSRRSQAFIQLCLREVPA